MTERYGTREEWLHAAIEEFRPWFEDEGESLPERLRVTVGWMSVGVTKVVIGETWVPDVSGDHTTEVFINPLMDDPLRVLDILLHELVHAAGKRGHKKDFKDLAVAVGLEGPMTATTATPELRQSLEGMVKWRLGRYPHKSLDPWSAVPKPGAPGETLPPVYRKPSDRPKSQKARLFKVTCVGDHGDQGVYTVRVTRKWIAVGLPTCPDGHAMEVTDINWIEEEDAA